MSDYVQQKPTLIVLSLPDHPVRAMSPDPQITIATSTSLT